MYLGEVNIAQDELNSFLTVAEDLKVKGLTQNKGEEIKESTTKLEGAHPSAIPKQYQTNPQILKPKRPAFSQPLSSHSNYTPTPEYHPEVEEEDIQEVIPVKAEPQETYHQASDVDNGVVALEDDYPVMESYESQYEYEETAGNASLDLESVILSKMCRNADGDWQCNDCFKTSKWKTNIVEHIEATHVESPGYQCEVCNKFCRTRNALRKHKYVNHR